jgi:hypothetical protein
MSMNHEALSMPLSWRKSSFCANTECAEVAARDGVIYMRNSAHPSNGGVAQSVQSWRDLVQAIKAGEFDDLVSSS